MKNNLINRKNIDMKYLAIIFFALNVVAGFGQTKAIDYQTVITDPQGDVINLVEVELQVDLIQDNASGTTVYSETHTTNSGLSGEVSIAIGQGTALGNDFSEVDWEKPHYIEISVKPEGFTSFISTGTVELLSVPYALFALNLTCEQGCPGADSNINGVAGAQGAQGPQGATGAWGATGPQGAQGASGIAGTPGLLTLEATSVVPSNPSSTEMYLDDGTNRPDGVPGFRFYNGSQWINL